MDDDIEFKDIEEKPFKEIVKVAKSLGVKANGKKESIIKRIQSKIKQKNKVNEPKPEYQKEAIEKIQQKQLQQQQSKIIDDKPIPSTTGNGNSNEELKEILNNKLNSREEKLFWSVFKNKFLKFVIWSTIKKGEPLFGNSYRYNQINNVEWILKNGFTQLLRDKVFNGEYLTFNCQVLKTEKCIFEYTSGINFKYDGYYNGFKGDYHEYSIFNSFKSDYSFHSKLLINYPLYFKPTSIEMVEELERIATKYDNLALFQVLENEYQLVSSFGAFEEAVVFGSVEIAYHLFTTLKFDIKPKEMASLWKSILTTLNDSNDCKLFNKRIDLFFNRLCIDKPIQPITSFNLFSFLLHKESLGTLIECCLSVAYLKPQLQGFIDSFPTDENKKLSKLLDDPITLDLKSEKFTLLSIDELMVIKKKYFGLDQLDWKPHEFNSNDKHHDISSVFNMLIMFTSSISKCIIENYKFYKANYHGKIYGNNYIFNGKKAISKSVFNYPFLQFKQAIEMLIKKYPNLEVAPLKITLQKGSKLAHQEIYYILNHENQKLVNLLMDGKIENVDSKDLIPVSYLKSRFDSDNQRSSLDFINGISGNLELLISKYSLKSVVSSLTPLIILNSDIQLLDYLISRIKSLSNKSDSDKQIIISGLVINILENELGNFDQKRSSYYITQTPKTIVCQNNNYTIIKYLLDNFKSVFEKNVALNFFNNALNNGNIDVVKLLIDELGFELLSDSELNTKTYNYFIPIYLKTHYPSKFKSIENILK